MHEFSIYVFGPTGDFVFFPTKGQRRTAGQTASLSERFFEPVATTAFCWLKNRKPPPPSKHLAFSIFPLLSNGGENNDSRWSLDVKSVRPSSFDWRGFSIQNESHPFSRDLHSSLFSSSFLLPLLYSLYRRRLPSIFRDEVASKQPRLAPRSCFLRPIHPFFSLPSSSPSRNNKTRFERAYCLLLLAPCHHHSCFLDAKNTLPYCDRTYRTLRPRQP